VAEFSKLFKNDDEIETEQRTIIEEYKDDLHMQNNYKIIKNFVEIPLKNPSNQLVEFPVKNQIQEIPQIDLLKQLS